MDYTNTDAVKRLQKALTNLEQNVGQIALSAQRATENVVIEIPNQINEEFKTLQKEYAALKKKQAESRLKVEQLIEQVEKAITHG